MFFIFRFFVFIYLYSSTSFMIPSYAQESDFTFAIAADPQPYRILNMPNNYDPNANSSVSIWKPLAQAGYANMRKYKPEFVMINGDMTEFGWEPQRNSVAKLIRDNYDIPTYYGLGNHDIFNNVGDCHGNFFDDGYTSSDQCAWAMSNMLRGDVAFTFARHNPRGYYSHSAIGSNRAGWAASNAYAFDWKNDLRFIQMNFYPSYEVHLGAPGAVFNTQWTSAVPFLKQELAKARKDKRLVILGWHDADDHFLGDKGKDEVIQLLRDNNDIIILLTAGHEHRYIHFKNYQETGIDMILAGALFNKESLIIDFSKREIFHPTKNRTPCYNETTKSITVKQIKEDGTIGEQLPYSRYYKERVCSPV
ncbi:metallophosphoesterase [Brucella sp. 21LCYQ03]|nr:metallophosphoesterase [Brucella sp. 21LCYQ03]